MFRTNSQYKKKAGDVDLIDIGKNMKAELDKFVFDDIQHVVIENQLSPLASRMKTIQGMLKINILL